MACLAKVPGGKVAEHLTQCSSLLLHEGRQDRPEAPPFPLSEGWPVAQACRAAEAGGGLSLPFLRSQRVCQELNLSFLLS